ncbi:MAG: acyl-CoA dehydrogenase family protein [Acidimicrobiia bacterium]|nr:acyl-CoA dehydrogenase family protein [Acidimicrobiia bacterium]
MDMTFSAEEEAFRAEVRAWLEGAPVPDAEAPEGDLDAEVEALRHWQAQLAAARFVGVHWPEELGGRGLSWTHNFLVQLELAAARAPEVLNRIGVNLVGPTLLAHGTPAQKQRWLPAILPARELWCQLFSEPGAGSDLASLTTRARRSATGRGWVVDGQKVWSSYAQYARWGYLLARTDPDVPAQRGITAMVVDMEAAGVEVRPLRQMTGESEFNEVFLTGVAVPDDAVIGPPGQGWAIAATTLAHERGTSPRQLVVHTMLVDEMLRRARAGGGVADPVLRGRLAQAYAELTIFRLHNYRTLTDVARRGAPGPAASVVKLFWSEMSQRMHETALALLGPTAVTEPGDAEAARIVRNSLYYRAATIFAGTSEIQRNVIGERSLGLPREPRV